MSAIVAALKTEAQKEAEKPRLKDAEKPIIKTDDNINEKHETEPDFSIYEKIKGVPYTVE